MAVKVRKHKRELRETKERIVGKQQGYTVIARNKMYPRGYVGMNSHAADELNITYPHDKKTVAYWTGLNAKDEALTIQHEIDEANLMSQGMTYSPAHKRAEKLERLGLERRVGDKKVPKSPSCQQS